jgi:hypothetical protein
VAEGVNSQVCATSPRDVTTCVAVDRTGKGVEGLPPEVLAPVAGGGTTAWTVGVGWYVYLYLNPSDVNWLVGLGFAGASGAVCAMLVGTIAGAFVCAAGAYIVWQVITSFYQAIPAGHCLELKFRLGYNGRKLVRRNC